VRVLLDESLPRRLIRLLPDHDCITVQDQGWSGMKNSELLRAATAAGFQVFLTADQGIAYQQNLESADMATVILAAKTSSPADLEPLMSRVAQLLSGIRPGVVIKIAA